jgi:transposase
MRAYSKDLRLKVLAAIDRGVPRKEVAQIFGVSLPTIKRWLKRRRETGDVEPKQIPGPPARKGAALEQALPSQLRANPDFTLEEHRELFEETYGISVSTASITAGLSSGLVCHSKKDTLRFRARRGRAGEVALTGS